VLSFDIKAPLLSLIKSMTSSWLQKQHWIGTDMVVNGRTFVTETVSFSQRYITRKEKNNCHPASSNAS
jgi:hypothetical protein